MPKKESKNTLKFSIDNGCDISKDIRKRYRNREKTYGNYDYINWGTDNNLPNYLYNLYSDCTLLGLIIDQYVDYVIGDGLEINSKIEQLCNKINVNNDSLIDILPYAISDYFIYGGFCFQGINSIAGDLSELYFTDLRDFRISGDMKSAYINYEWLYGSRKSYKLPIFDKNEDQPSFIYYYKGKKARGYYPITSWHSAILPIETQIKIQEFQYNLINNDFTPSAIVNINNGIPSDEQKEEFDRAFASSNTGIRNAGKILTIYNDNQDQAATITKIESDNYIDKYNTVDESSKNSIYATMRCAPPLVGILNQTTGFSEQEFNELFKLLNKTVINPVQDIFELCMDELFRIENSIRFKRFNPNSLE